MFVFIRTDVVRSAVTGHRTVVVFQMLRRVLNCIHDTLNHLGGGAVPPQVRSEHLNNKIHTETNRGYLLKLQNPRRYD